MGSLLSALCTKQNTAIVLRRHAFVFGQSIDELKMNFIFIYSNKHTFFSWEFFRQHNLNAS